MNIRTMVLGTVGLALVVACAVAQEKKEAPKTQLYVNAIDLKDDPALMDKYVEHHKAVWPEVLTTLKTLGVTQDRIYKRGNRLVMLLEVPEGFDPAKDLAKYTEVPKCKEWSDLMTTFQQPVPAAKGAEGWAGMEKVFDLNEQAKALGVEVKEPAGKTKMLVNEVDLKDDPKKMAEYLEYHRKPFPEVIKVLKEINIAQDRIYKLGNRLVMLLEVPENFDFAKDLVKYTETAKCKEWDELMKTFQQSVPGSKEGELWVGMDKVFDLNEQAEALKKTKDSGK